MANLTGSLIEDISLKKEIRSAKKLYEISGQAPSPSKDYCHLLVTEKGIVWIRWNITLRNRSQGWFPTPQELVMSYEDFEYDDSFKSDLERIFGSKCAKHVRRIVARGGCRDPFSCLPEDVAIRVITYLDLQSITRLSQTNQYFRELCDSDTLWEKLYIIHQGQPSVDIRAVAVDVGWKKLFFMNKLQVQKEISRLRRKAPPSPTRGGGGATHVPAQSTSSTPDTSTFLTQQVED